MGSQVADWLVGWLSILKLFSSKKVTASFDLVSGELLSSCEFGARRSGSGGHPGKRQQDGKAESDISLTTVTFHFQPCKCLFAKNRTACARLHLVCSLRCSVYERACNQGSLEKDIAIFWVVLWLLWTILKWKRAGSAPLPPIILAPIDFCQAGSESTNR